MSPGSVWNVTWIGWEQLSWLCELPCALPQDGVEAEKALTLDKPWPAEIKTSPEYSKHSPRADTAKKINSTPAQTSTWGFLAVTSTIFFFNKFKAYILDNFRTNLG